MNLIHHLKGSYLIIGTNWDYSRDYSREVNTMFTKGGNNYDNKTFKGRYPDSNDMLDPRGHDVDRPHSLRVSDVGNPGTNASLLVGATWDPHDGSTSDPHMPECRFHVAPTFIHLILSL